MPVDLMKLMVIYMPLQCSILSLSVSLAEGFGNEMEVASSLGKESESVLSMPALQALEVAVVQIA